MSSVNDPPGSQVRDAAERVKAFLVAREERGHAIDEADRLRSIYFPEAGKPPIELLASDVQLLLGFWAAFQNVPVPDDSPPAGWLAETERRALEEMQPPSVAGFRSLYGDMKPEPMQRSNYPFADPPAVVTTEDLAVDVTRADQLPASFPKFQSAETPEEVPDEDFPPGYYKTEQKEEFPSEYTIDPEQGC